MNNKFYSYGKQTIEDDDIDAVVEVLKSDWLTQGPAVERFETDLRNKFDAKYAVAVSNGTAGLHLIGLALGWKRDDIVITTPITFVASANCILYCDATPDFVDIDPSAYTMDVNKLEEKIINYNKIGKKVKAVVAVDYAGLPCNWKKLRELGDNYNFQLVNDNCHALGAEINDDMGYASKYAEAVNMSFHPVKHITTGEGGAILTNSEQINENVKMLRSHGITKDKKYLLNDEGPWYYEMLKLGYNYRITDIQCALGSSQLKKLDYFIKRRNEIASYYNEEFKNDERFIVPNFSGDAKHAFHLYPLQIRFDKLKIGKKQLFEKMKEKNIALQVHYIPVHLQPYYIDNFGFKINDYPIAEKFYTNEVSIPIYPLLENDDLDYIVKNLKELAF